MLSETNNSLNLRSAEHVAGVAVRAALDSGLTQSAFLPAFSQGNI